MYCYLFKKILIKTLKTVSHYLLSYYYLCLIASIIITISEYIYIYIYIYDITDMLSYQNVII